MDPVDRQTERPPRVVGPSIGDGALVGAALGAVLTLPMLVTLLVSSLSPKPLDAEGLYVTSGATIVALPIDFGFLGALVGLIIGIRPSRSRRGSAVRTTICALVMGAGASAVAWILLPGIPVAVAVLAVVIPASAAALGAGYPAARIAALRLRASAISGLVVGTVGGALVAAAGYVVSEYTLEGSLELASFGTTTPDPLSVPTVGTVVAIGIGSVVGLLTGVVAGAVRAALGSRPRLAAWVAVGTVFVTAGVAGPTRARLESDFFTQPLPLETRWAGEYRILLPATSSPVWPQALLVGIEWGVTAAAAAIVVIGTRATRAEPRPPRSLLLWGTAGGFVGGVLLSAANDLGTLLDAVLEPDPSGDFGPGDFLYGTPAGYAILAASGALLGLLLAQTVRVLLSIRPTASAAMRTAIFLVPTLALAALPYVHLALFPRDAPVDAEVGSLTVVPVIVGQVVLALILARRTDPALRIATDGGAPADGRISRR